MVSQKRSTATVAIGVNLKGHFPCCNKRKFGETIPLAKRGMHGSQADARRTVRKGEHE